MANYEVAPEILQPRLPNGVALDLFDGKCFVSLVAFMFTDTRVLRVAVPFHVNFEEVNLRFYVRRETEAETRRGVCFVKEIVPRAAIATVARVFYGEPYEAWKMSHQKIENDLTYAWWKGDDAHYIKVETGANTGVPAANSHGEFIIEHYWGYTKRGTNRTDEYRVEHPKWEIFEIVEHEIKVNFGTLYGAEFAFLNDAPPVSIFMAKGSEVAVYKGEKISA